MATDSPTAETEETGDAKTVAAGSGKKKIIITVAAVMILEAVLFAVIFGFGGSSEMPEDTEDTESVATEDLIEVPIEKISCTNSQAAPGTTISLTVELSALVDPDQETEFAEAASKEYKSRIKDACLRVFRSASLDDLSDPECTTVKRQIREQINKVMRKSVIRDIAISVFQKNES